MILLESDNTRRHLLRHMANIIIRYNPRYWEIHKHRYAHFDTELRFRLSMLEYYINIYKHSEIYGTPESYGKNVIVTVMSEQDAKWLCISDPMYQVADLVLVEHVQNGERYYSIMKNAYNPHMEMRSYTTLYIDDLIQKYQRRPY